MTSTRARGASARRDRHAVRLLAGTALALTALAGCGSSGGDAAGPGATPSTTRASTTTTGRPAATGASMRAKRYCEVLLLQVADGSAVADVYNTFPLNGCPEATWTALDAGAIAKEHDVTLARLNGPRYWLMDHVEKQGGTKDLPLESFGGLEMYRQASVDVGPIAQAGKPYTPNAVDRKTVFTFDAGQQVYELTDPDGARYVMQSWSQQVDPTLVEGDLAGLATRLRLPAGWSFRARTLTEPLRVVTTSSAAKVLQDDLENSYSQLPD